MVEEKLVIKYTRWLIQTPENNMFYLFLISVIVCTTVIILAKVCSHKWEIINTRTVRVDDGTEQFIRYHLQCTKCGITINKDMK
jgi:hypothetical protein